MEVYTLKSITILILVLVIGTVFASEISYIRYYANEKDFIANVPMKATNRRGYDHLTAYFNDRNLPVKLEYYISNGSLKKREIMEYIAPLGPVYQAGTLSGNPVAMAAGLKTLELVSADGFLDPVIERTDRLVKGLVERATQAGIPMTSNHVGTMWGFFFSEEERITHYQQVMACDTERFAKFFHHMLDEGVYLAPASYEASFMSAAHTDEDIEFTLDAAERSLNKL